MSYKKDITICCDQPECDAQTPSSVANSQSVQSVRRYIRSTGWTYTVERGDRCPTHSNKETS